MGESVLFIEVSLFQRSSLERFHCTFFYMQHDWLTVLGGVFKPSGVDIEPSSVVLIGNQYYFNQLTDLVRNTSNE